MSNGNSENSTNTTQEQLRPTPASQWRKQTKEGEPWRLGGSDNVAVLRRPALMAMVVAGSVPNPISADVLKFLADSGDNLRTLSDAQKQDVYRRNGRAFIEIAKMCFVEPRLVTDRPPNYDNDEIAPDDVVDGDYLWLIFTFVEGSAERLRYFRIPSVVGANGQDSSEIRQVTVGDSEAALLEGAIPPV